MVKHYSFKQKSIFLPFGSDFVYSIIGDQKEGICRLSEVSSLTSVGPKQWEKKFSVFGLGHGTQSVLGSKKIPSPWKGT